MRFSFGPVPTLASLRALSSTCASAVAAGRWEGHRGGGGSVCGQRSAVSGQADMHRLTSARKHSRRGCWPAPARRRHTPCPGCTGCSPPCCWSRSPAGAVPRAPPLPRRRPAPLLLVSTRLPAGRHGKRWRHPGESGDRPELHRRSRSPWPAWLLPAARPWLWMGSRCLHQLLRSRGGPLASPRGFAFVSSAPAWLRVDGAGWGAVLADVRFGDSADTAQTEGRSACNGDLVAAQQARSARGRPPSRLSSFPPRLDAAAFCLSFAHATTALAALHKWSAAVRARGNGWGAEHQSRGRDELLQSTGGRPAASRLGAAAAPRRPSIKLSTAC